MKNNKTNIAANVSNIPVRAVRWRNIIFFVITTLVAVIGMPYYIGRFGISPSEIALTVFYTIATGSAITVGYHRLFSHVAFKAHPLVRFFVLFFGAAAYEQSALKWSSQHRRHHRYVDTEQDPYNIKQGFFHAHIGWLLFWRQLDDFSNVTDLQKSRLLMHQHRYYFAWAIFSGMVVPLAIGAMTGHLLGAFIVSICFRLTFVYHATFFINSVCHSFGRATYDLESSARDHWFVALLTGGEGYHNFHHKFPGDYRNGIRWYHWDPSKWTIYLLSRVGLAWELNEISKPRILAAQLETERRRVHQSLEYLGAGEFTLQTVAKLKEMYLTLKQSLEKWEVAVHQYQQNMSKPDFELMARMARRAFTTRYREWQKLIKLNPIHLQNVLLSLPSGALS